MRVWVLDPRVEGAGFSGAEIWFRVKGLGLRVERLERPGEWLSRARIDRPVARTCEFAVWNLGIEFEVQGVEFLR